jgi:hypothetical protein
MNESLILDGEQRSGDTIQAFVPNPNKSLASSTTGTVTFGKAATGYTVDITGYAILLVSPTATSTYYYNGDTTKTKTLTASVDNLIFVGQANVTSVTLTLSTATAEIQAM